MNTDKPMRIQLIRKKGFRLQKFSRDLNGLAAVKVTRPGKFGNPQPVNEKVTARQAVAVFKDYLHDMLKIDPKWLDPLRGKNLACWCWPNDICHADLLLKAANE